MHNIISTWRCMGSGDESSSTHDLGTKGRLVVSFTLPSLVLGGTLSCFGRGGKENITATVVDWATGIQHVVSPSLSELPRCDTHTQNHRFSDVLCEVGKRARLFWEKEINYKYFKTQKYVIRSKGNEESWICRLLYHEEICVVCRTPSVVDMKSRRLEWDGNEVGCVDQEMYAQFCWEFLLVEDLEGGGSERNRLWEWETVSSGEFWLSQCWILPSQS